MERLDGAYLYEQDVLKKSSSGNWSNDANEEQHDSGGLFGTARSPQDVIVEGRSAFPARITASVTVRQTQTHEIVLWMDREFLE